MALTYTRSGGITGQTVSAQLTLGKSPEGYNRSRVQSILALASRQTLRDLQLPRVPANLCCDRYIYTMRVAYSDGSVRMFQTADGLRKPAPLRRLLAAVS